MTSEVLSYVYRESSKLQVHVCGNYVLFGLVYSMGLGLAALDLFSNETVGNYII